MDLPAWSSGVSQHILRIEDGKSVVGVFRGTIHRYYEHWVGGRSALCTRSQGNCQYCASEDENVRKGKGRFRVNFIIKDPETGEPKAKILEGGKKLYEQMVNINKECPLDTVWIRISRTGTKQQTQWFLNVLPGEKGTITPAAQKKLQQIGLHDVTGGAAPEAEDDSETATTSPVRPDEGLAVESEEDLPF